MKIINQHDRYIDGKKNKEKIKHMIDNGYGSITIDGIRVTYDDTIPTEDGDIIRVNVEKPNDN